MNSPSPAVSWESSARAKLLSIDAEHAAARGRYVALSDRISTLQNARNLKAGALASLLQRGALAERAEDIEALERSISKARQEINELDALIEEASRQRNAAEQSAQPLTRLRERARKLLIELGVVGNEEL